LLPFLVLIFSPAILNFISALPSSLSLPTATTASKPHAVMTPSNTITKRDDKPQTYTLTAIHVHRVYFRGGPGTVV
jgi:hypothetical protein